MPRTRRRWHAYPLLTAALVSALAIGNLAGPAHGDAGEEAQIVAMINSVRARHGVRPVAVHAELRALANDWAQRMRDARNYFHSPLAQRVTANWITVGENVGAEAGVVEIQRAFEASPGHLATLVDPRFNYVGVGVAWGSDGTIYVVQDFMELAVAASTAAPASGSAQLPRRAPAPSRAAPASRPAAAAPARAAASDTPVSPPPSSSQPSQPPPPPPPAEPSPYLSTVMAQLQTLDSQVADRLRG